MCFLNVNDMKKNLKISEPQLTVNDKPVEKLTTEEMFATGKDSLMCFCILVDRGYEVGWHHETIGKVLKRAEKGVMEGGRPKFILLEVPPRHGKSELASIKFPAWFLGRHPDKEIITASYSAELATDFGSKTRDLVNSEEYKMIFNVELREDSQSKAKWVTKEGGSYTSVGVGGALTGRGANILLIDDPIKSREEADSELIRDKIWEWFRSTAYSRLEPNGAVIVIMQRWHKFDLIGKIISEFGDRTDIDLDIISLPAIAIKDEASKFDRRKAGEALWPQRYSKEALASIRATVGEMAWAAQYQQEPILQENQEFRSEYFRYFEEGDLLNKVMNFTITVDLATGDKEVKRGDSTVITTVGKEISRPEWYIVDVTEGRLDPLQTCDALFSLWYKYRPDRILIEDNGYQKTFKFWLEEEMKKRGTYLPIQTVTHNTQKEKRIRGLVPMYKTGVIYHRRHYLKLESELLNFPYGEHDDCPDSLAMMLEVIKPTERNNDYDGAAEMFAKWEEGKGKMNHELGIPINKYDAGTKAMNEFIRSSIP